MAILEPQQLAFLDGLMESPEAANRGGRAGVAARRALAACRAPPLCSSWAALQWVAVGPPLPQALSHSQPMPGTVLPGTGALDERHSRGHVRALGPAGVSDSSTASGLSSLAAAQEAALGLSSPR
jgi:hypothetical protein